MRLVETALMVQKVCDQNETCRLCPLNGFMDICNILYVGDPREMERFIHFEKRLRREAKRAEYLEQWGGKSGKSENVPDVPGKESESVLCEQDSVGSGVDEGREAPGE